MLHTVTVLPINLNIPAEAGSNLLEVLRGAGLVPDAPCGGEGRCGKCKVLLDGREVLACRTTVDRTLTVTLPQSGFRQILTTGLEISTSIQTHSADYSLAFDIGTTTVVGYLLKGSEELVSVSMGNPQVAFGADVVSRIRHGTQGYMPELTRFIRECLEELTTDLCRRAEVSARDIQLVSVVGNPAMQQFLLGLSVDNLAKVPFLPVLTKAKQIPAKGVLPLWENGVLLIVPDIAGFVGADMVACILTTALDQSEEISLLVDIGTNGEMVLGNRHRMVACSAAAGPALEGANIRFGMRGQEGAIDHVHLEKGEMRCSVIGGGKAAGICGSGLIDAVATALDAGLLNERGKILTADGLIHLTDEIYLTQEDIRQVQLAKGAIAAGIQLMAKQMNIALSDIHTVHLAGAFGTYMNSQSACRIGLLPKVLEERITAAGNAAGSGAKLLACSGAASIRVQEILSRTKALELAALPEFPRCFAQNMRF